MRIPCPFCGERTIAEFGYLGDAAPVRPDPKAGMAAFHDYVHIRDNPPGTIREWWQHVGGCRCWLVVERNVTTHEIGTVTAASALKRGTREPAR